MQFARKVDQGRFSSGGGSGGIGIGMGIGIGIERPPALSNDPSVTSAGEGGVGWIAEGGGGRAAGEEEGGGGGGGVGGEEGEGGEGDDDKAVGPFTDTSLEMARLRLPDMELGFEEDGFFGIDVRSLIIGREIARGAYGVVHEGKLLPSRPKEEQQEQGEGVEGEDGEQPGILLYVPVPCSFILFVECFMPTRLLGPLCGRV